MTDAQTRPISLPELEALLARIFVANGCAEPVAAILAQNCAAAERDGSVSHGVFRIEGYVRTLRSGWVDGTAVPVLEDAAPGFLRVDAKNGFAQPALARARRLFAERVRANGIALLAIRNSHHFAALWPDVEPFAEEGLIAIAMVNSMTCSVPHGAVAPVFGTNPLALAAPVEGLPPVVFDMATTTMAHGDVQVARREGRMLPEGTGRDAQGNLTGDPAKILEGGALVPFGGHKGSAISLMIELLCAGLSGGNFSFGFSWKDHPGAQTPHTGEIIIGIDPTHAGGAAFAGRSAELMARLAEAGLKSYPGKRRQLERARRSDAPLALPAATLERLEALAGGAA